jgi:CO/xanthine dehydrogenase Mo-binding subunit
VIEAADRYVRGAGEFSDDRWVETATHAVVVRSPHAHARIAPIAVSAALARSGVLAIFTGRDIVEHLRPLPCLVGLTSRDGRPRAEADRAILATDRVRHVGGGVAFVVAETLSQAAARQSKAHVQRQFQQPHVLATSQLFRSGRRRPTIYASTGALATRRRATGCFPPRPT